MSYFLAIASNFMNDLHLFSSYDQLNIDQPSITFDKHGYFDLS
jgi:hypothetical protein